MAYGDRRGARRGQGEAYNPLDMVGFGIASAFGIAFAAFFDLTQSDEGAALPLFNKWLTVATDTLGFSPLPLYSVVLILMALGGLSILVLQPVTMRGAFAQGFGVLAAITTLAPADLGEPMVTTNDASMPGGMDEMLPPGGDIGSMFPDLAEDISFGDPAIAPQPAVMLIPASMTAAAQSQGYTIRMRIVFPNGLKRDIGTMVRDGGLRGRLHNEATNRTYNLFRSTGGDLVFQNNTIYIASRIPGTEATADLVSRIEADGYRIVEERFEASQGANPIWTIQMQESGVPIVLQRLQRPYTF